MNESQIEPASASADGKRNSYVLNCTPTGQSMNYAACIFRQSTLSTPGAKFPADWLPCDTARKCGGCVAVEMRKEEEIAGKAIYFKDRSLVQKMTDAARAWFTPPVELPKKTTRPSSILDSIANVGSLADALTAAAKDSGSPSIAPASMALPGESPLMMARRLNGAR